MIPTGLRLFVGGLELWCYIQTHWLASSFRLQAFGVLLLVYWIVGALWCLRDRGSPASRHDTYLPDEPTKKSKNPLGNPPSFFALLYEQQLPIGSSGKGQFQRRYVVFPSKQANGFLQRAVGAALKEPTPRARPSTDRDADLFARE